MAEKKKNDRRKWTENEILSLWVHCGGRCTLCGKDLLRNPLSGDPDKYGELAHIVAHSPGGPRANGKFAYDELESTDNIIVLCRDCHKGIDSNPEKYPEDWLKRKKAQRENKVSRQLLLPDNASRQAIVFTAPIAGTSCKVSEREINAALFNSDLFPGCNPPLRIELQEIDNETTPEFWGNMARKLETKYRQLNPESTLDDGYAVFGIAPMPLLIKFGALLTDLQNATIFNLFRSPDRKWCWNDDTHLADNTHFISVHDNATENPACKKALVISLTSDISERVKSYGEFNIWEVRASNIGYESIQSRQHLEDFRKVVLATLDEMSKGKGNIYIFIAAPNSAAIMLGMCLKVKVNQNVIIYEYLSSKNGDKEALTIPCL